MTKQYDVIINGSGIVGLFLACSLAKTSLKIAVIDRVFPPQLTAEYDNRVYAITRASQQGLQQLGVWEDIINERVSPYHKMHVWDKTGDGEIHFDCRDIGEPNLGHIIENAVIQHALIKKIKTLPQIDMIFPIQLTGCDRYSDQHFLRTNDDDSYSAPLLIGADGANSWVREQLGFTLRTWSYGHEGLIATVKCELPHEKVARECFMPQGPLAFLPLDDSHTCSIVWSTESEHAHRLLAMSDSDFKSELASEFCHRLGKIDSISKRLSFPLHMRHASQYVKEGCALVGDSAHTIHPLAGQGVNLGILDAVALSDVIIDAVNKRRSYFSVQTLSRYERQRKAHNLGMIALMEGFKQLFSWQNPLAKFARNKGLNVTDNFPLLKRQFMWQALGGKTVEFE